MIPWGSLMASPAVWLFAWCASARLLRWRRDARARRARCAFCDACGSLYDPERAARGGRGIDARRAKEEGAHERATAARKREN